MSRSSRARGLKRGMEFLFELLLVVGLFESAWIENLWRDALHCLWPVALFASAWIETTRMAYR